MMMNELMIVHYHQFFYHHCHPSDDLEGGAKVASARQSIKGQLAGRGVCWFAGFSSFSLLSSHRKDDYLRCNKLPASEWQDGGKLLS